MSDKKILHVIVYDKSDDTQHKIDVACVGPNYNSDEENAIQGIRGNVGMSKDELQEIIDGANSNVHHVYALVPR